MGKGRGLEGIEREGGWKWAGLRKGAWLSRGQGWERGGAWRELKGKGLEVGVA